MTSQGKANGKSQTPLSAVTESGFYRRLVTLAKKDGEVRSLLTTVDHVTGQAEAISRHVVAFLPQYTDHGERHLLNVLGFMETLAGPENLQKLCGLECALAILAAFVHDLGMVPPETEQNILTDSTEGPKTTAETAWQTFRDGHTLWHRYLRLTEPARRSRSGQAMFGQVRADYLRESHAKEGSSSGYHRILGWLGLLSSGQGDGFFRHRGYDYRAGLAHLAMSHGQPVDWLPQRLAAQDSPYVDIREHPAQAFAWGRDQVNWIWLSWLLRLADVMDCDASRTPKVLFEAIGITDPKSQVEWKKHLAFPNPPRFEQGPDGKTLLYDCPECPDPFTEKAIHEILGWINSEIRGVRQVMASAAPHLPKDKRLSLGLPGGAEARISQRSGNYHFLDLHFRLDRDAVMELLMGEALYGEPDLALRELVQNALDALHLRDLRHRLLLQLRKESSREELPVPVEPPLQNEALAVHVRWQAPADGHAWIEVEDNGVGMTREVIERFLTQIGKSYYKSPEYLREKELMRRHGLLCTTISQFGIGFLSSFMLANEVEIKTRAKSEDKQAPYGWRVHIHESHGLIALYPLAKHEIETTGTRVRLQLKAGLKLEPFDRDRWVRRLRQVFYRNRHLYAGEEDSQPEGHIEPAWSVGRCIVWPLFPIHLQPADSPELILDDTFHTRELLPLDPAGIRAMAKEWSWPDSAVGNPRWAVWDWYDDGPGGTGSRIRLTTANHGPDPVDGRWLELDDEVPGRMRRTELATLVESRLPGEGRTMVLVNGVLVPEWKRPLADWLVVTHNVGSCLWLDLRGRVTPRLRADRRAPTEKQEIEAEVREVEIRFTRRLAGTSFSMRRWLALTLSGLAPVGDRAIARAWSVGSLFPGLIMPSNAALWTHQAFALAGQCSKASIDELSRLNINFDRTWHVYSNALPIGRKNFTLALARDLTRNLRSAIRLTDNSTHIFALATAPELKHAHPLALKHAIANRTLNPRVLKHYEDLTRTHLLAEALGPTCESGFPPLRCPALSGPVGALGLGGPMILRRPNVGLPDWLERTGVDLIAPFTAIPFGDLARRCSNWHNERAYRPLFTLPFLLPGFPKQWSDKRGALRAALGVDSLLLYLPDLDHYDKAFEPIPTAEFGDGPVAEALPEKVWRRSGATALWDIPAGRVLWGPGLQTREDLAKNGQTLDSLLDLPQSW
jgi:hypothetical protein